jgi:hypothetical protein
MHYETIQRNKLNKGIVYECRCDARLKAKAEGSTCLDTEILFIFFCEGQSIFFFLLGCFEREETQNVFWYSLLPALAHLVRERRECDTSCRSDQIDYFDGGGTSQELAS